MDITKHKKFMPYIVVIVDEMSDLMLVSGKKLKIIFKTFKWQEQPNSHYNGAAKCRCNYWNN